MANQLNGRQMKSSTIVMLVIGICCWLPTVAMSQQTSPSEEGLANDYGIPEVRRINQEIRTGWSEYEITPSKKATDGEWCRRVYLDVIGRVPSVQELNDFLSSTETDKQKQLVNKLLYDEDYIELYANNWTTIWTNVLVGRSGGTERNSLTNREGLQKYLRDSLARNKSFA